MFEMLKFEKKYKGRKNTKNGENLKASCQTRPSLQNMCPINDNIFFLIIWLKHYFSSFLQKRVVENIVKGLIMLKIQSQKNLPDKLPIIYCKNFRNYFFVVEMNFEN